MIMHGLVTATSVEDLFDQASRALRITFHQRINMLKNIFFTLVFFILDHAVLSLAASLIGVIAMKYCYRIWQDQMRAPDTRYMSLIIVLFLAFLLLIFIAGIVYIITIIIVFFPELRKLMGK
jgi:ABC-type polysaccharide/polyol phosphate export permease